MAMLAWEKSFFGRAARSFGAGVAGGDD